MSKKTAAVVEEATAVVKSVATVSAVAPVSVPFPPQEESLTESDKALFEVARMKQRLALAAAEKALAQNETAELNFKYLLLQLYIRYGLDTAADALTEDGKIKRGALLNQAAQ